MSQFYLMHEGRKLGPVTREEIVQKLKDNNLSWTSYFLEENTSQWKVLIEDEYFLGAFKVLNPSPAFEAEGQQDTSGYLDDLFQTKDWYVLKGTEQVGPYTYIEMVKLLQQKKIFEFEFVWSPKMAGWLRLSEVDDFYPERIRALKNSGMSEIQEVFFRRKYPRASLAASILVHNNKEVWKGTTQEVGPGGAGFVLDATRLELGQNIFIHLKAGDDLPSFNAIATVVSLYPVEETKFRYGVKFTKISQNVQKAILSFAEKAGSGLDRPPASFIA